MNKEEKEVIEELKEEINKPVELSEDKFNTFILFNIESAKVVLNYIDKLQKRLNQLKEVDRQICNEELITKDKYQEILKENEELKIENDFLKLDYDNLRTIIIDKRNDLIDQYATSFYDIKHIYLAINIIDEILNDSEVKKWQQ